MKRDRGKPKSVGKGRRRQTGGFELTPEAADAVAAYWRRTMVPKKAIVTRVLTWFALQPAPVKRVILGDVDGELAPAYADVLRKLAADAMVVTQHPHEASPRSPGEPAQSDLPLKVADRHMGESRESVVDPGAVELEEKISDRKPQSPRKTRNGPRAEKET
jgi:anthranilate phosphoribosyltransferase